MKLTTYAQVLLLAYLLWSSAAYSRAIPVELRHNEQGWQLIRAGEPYFIRGAGGGGSLDQLAAAGANSVRTWGADDIGAMLDEAHALGLTVTVGIWLGHTRHGFDYNDKSQVKQQLERARQTVLRYRDHPALLLWGIGNEMEGYASGDDPVIWDAVNEIAAMVNKLDPAHPTMTVTADIGGGRIKRIQEQCPSIDIHGINSYGGSQSLVERYRASGASRPYVLTEFGPPGAWEVENTEWGAPIEPTSTQKAAFYRLSYERAVIDAAGLALGSYAFNWGSRMEATATWYGMFLADGSPLEAVDVMTRIWSGKPAAKPALSLEPLIIETDSIVDPDAEVRVRAVIHTGQDSDIKVRWVLRRETDDYFTGGDFRPLLPEIEGVIIEGRVDRARVRMPKEPGNYRLYLYVYNEAGRAATANLPLLVKGEVRTPMPFPVYEDGFEGMPWTPSGWMGSYESLTLQGDHAENPYQGKACIKMRYSGKKGWVGVAWQHPANNWGNQDGGYDLTGATQLELWLRGEYGGERINIGVGLLGEDTAHPDSGKTSVEDIVLKSEWQRYSIPLKNVDLSSIKTGLVVTVSGQPSSVTVYLDSIRFIH